MDQVHIERPPHVRGQPVDALLPFRMDEYFLFQRVQSAGRPGRGEEGVSESVIVEEAVKISAECAAAVRDSAIRARRGFPTALDLGERLGACGIGRFSQVDLVALKAR